MASIDNISLLVAHLAYNFRIRVELLVLLTSNTMMEVAEEDVLKGIECVDYLAGRMDLMRPTTELYSMWTFIKEQIRMYVVSKGAQGSSAEIRDCLKAVGDRISRELGLRVGAAVVQVFPHIYAVSLVTSSAIGERKVAPELATIYLQTASCIPSWYFSQRYWESMDHVRPLLVRSLEQNLNGSELKVVCNITTWQSRNFIYHVQLDSSTMSYHGSAIQGAVGLQDGHLNQTRNSLLPESRSTSEVCRLDGTPLSGQSLVHSQSAEEGKLDHASEGAVQKKIEIRYGTTSSNDDLVSPKSDVSTAGASSVPDLGGLAYVEDSGLIQDDLSSSSSVVETLRQHLHRTKSVSAYQWEVARIDDLVRDTTLRCKQLTADLEELNNALSTISNTVITQPLQDVALEKREQLEAENSVLQSLTQLREEVTRHSNTQQMTLPCFRVLMEPEGFIKCQLDRILKSAAADQELLWLLTACAIEILPRETMEGLKTELASYEYKHPDNRCCQQILDAVLSRKLSFT